MDRLRPIAMTLLVLVHFTAAGFLDFGRHVQAHAGDGRHAHSLVCFLESLIGHTGAQEDAQPTGDGAGLDLLLTQAGWQLATALVAPQQPAPPPAPLIRVATDPTSPVTLVVTGPKLARGPPTA